MKTFIEQNKFDLANVAGEKAAGIIQNAISRKGLVGIVIATGASQDELLKYLVSKKHIDWTKVVVFHLDEYIGISENHPASFRKYLKDYFLNQVGPVKEVHFVNGNAPDAQKECRRISAMISDYHIDLALVGIGENGHLAFNDPPADFRTKQPYIIVELDKRCRMQQVNEGCFPDIKEVPQKAISMSVQQIMKSENVICFVPDLRKAEAVRNCLEHKISNAYPASILRQHTSCNLYLDADSSSLLHSESLK